MASDVKYDKERDMAEVREFLPGYFNTDDVPEGEEDICAFIRDKFTAQREAYAELEKKYGGDLKWQAVVTVIRRYPGSRLLKEALDLTDTVLKYEKSNDMLLFTVAKLRNELSAAKERMWKVEHFFKEEVALYVTAEKLEQITWWPDMDCYRLDGEARALFSCLSGLLRSYDFHDFERLKELLKAIYNKADRLRLEKYGETVKLLEEARSEIRALVRTAEGKYIAEAAEAYYLDMEMLLKELLDRKELLTRMDGTALRIIRYKEKVIARMKKTEKPGGREEIITAAEKSAAGYFRTGETWVDEEDLPKFIRKGIERNIKEYSSFRYPRSGKTYAYLVGWALKTLQLLRKTEDDYEMMALFAVLAPILKRAGNRIMILKALVKTGAFLEKYRAENVTEEEKERINYAQSLWQSAWLEQEYTCLDGRIRGFFRLLGRQAENIGEEYRYFRSLENKLWEIKSLLRKQAEEKECEINDTREKCDEEITAIAKGRINGETLLDYLEDGYGDHDMGLRVMEAADDYGSPSIMEGLLMRILRYKDQLIEKMQTEIKEKKE